jgi:lysophospholipase L1-like esterase
MGVSEPPGPIAAETAGKIAFTQWHDSIWTTDPQGDTRGLVADGLDPHQPIWSPEGDRIAFLNTGGIFVVDAGGGVPTFVASPGFSVGGGAFGGVGVGHVGVSWHPSGDLIAYTQRVDLTDGTSKNFVSFVRPNGTGQRNVVEGAFPSWSPDGSVLAYLCPNTAGICLVGSDEAPHILVEVPRGITSLLSWAPDGGEVGFVRSGITRWDAYAVDVNTGNVRTITENVGSFAFLANNAPVWSPDGSMIAVGSSADTITVFDADGTNPRLITNRGSLEGLQVWSPDSQWINGSAIRNLTNDEVIRELVPSWCPAVQCGGEPPPAEIEYYALGDSVASGHGLFDDGLPCRRSLSAYPGDVLEKLLQRYGRVTRFEHLACTGATVLRPDGKTLKEDAHKWLHNQVNTALALLDQRPTGRPALVSITVGANDFEWGDPENVIRRLSEKESKFNAWVSSRVDEVVFGDRGLKAEVNRLLEHPDVAVVITQYHNPFNKWSYLFDFVRRFSFPRPACVPIEDCYGRTELGLHALNTALSEMSAAVSASDRLRIALVHQEFHGHESPSPSCGGFAEPDEDGTWVQYIGDPNSNSNPPPIKYKGNKFTFPPGGDCFHPNEIGAAQFAEAVNQAALTLSR